MKSTISLATFSTHTCQVMYTSVIKMLCPQDNMDRCWRTNMIKVNARWDGQIRQVTPKQCKEWQPTLYSEIMLYKTLLSYSISPSRGPGRWKSPNQDTIMPRISLSIPDPVCLVIRPRARRLSGVRGHRVSSSCILQPQNSLIPGLPPHVRGGHMN